MPSKHGDSVRTVAAALMGEPDARTVARLKRLDQAIVRHPKDPKLLAEKGGLLEGMLNFSEALKCYNRALEHTPKDLPTLMAKASLLERSSRETQAVKVLNLSIAAGGDAAELSFEQGRILHQSGRLKAAVPCYARCLSLRPHHKQAVMNLAAVMIGLSRYREALALCEEELKHHSQWPELVCSRGIAWMELGEVERACHDFEAALKLSHGNQTVFYNLACLSMKQKSPQKALAFLAKATKGNARLANQALMDREFAPLSDNLRFWRIIDRAVYLEGAMRWQLCKKFKVKNI